MDAEVTIDGGQVGRRHLAHQRLVAQPVADEVGDGDHEDAVLLGHLREVGHAGHGAVVVHDLADDAGGFKAGQLGEIDGSFGLPGSLEHAAALRPQGEDVAGAQQILGPGGRIDGG